MSGIVPHSFQLKKITSWRPGKSQTYDKEELKTLLKGFPEELEQYTQWLNELITSKKKDAEGNIAKRKQQKGLDDVSIIMRSENTLNMIKIIEPFAAAVKENQRAIAKKESVPEEIKKELVTCLYLADRFNLIGWINAKKQLALKYGTDFINDIETNQTDVDGKILGMESYKPHERIMRDRLKEIENLWKKKLQEEEDDLDIVELSDDVDTESDSHVLKQKGEASSSEDENKPRVSYERPERKKLASKHDTEKKSKKDNSTSDDASGSDDSDDDSKKKKKPKKEEYKKAESESVSEEESSEEEKKKSKKKSSGGAMSFFRRAAGGALKGKKKAKDSSESESVSASSEEEKKSSKKSKKEDTKKSKKAKDSSETESASGSSSDEKSKKKPKKSTEKVSEKKSVKKKVSTDSSDSSGDLGKPVKKVVVADKPVSEPSSVAEPPKPETEKAVSPPAAPAPAAPAPAAPAPPAPAPPVPTAAPKVVPKVTKPVVDSSSDSYSSSDDERPVSAPSKTAPPPPPAASAPPKPAPSSTPPASVVKKVPVSSSDSYSSSDDEIPVKKPITPPTKPAAPAAPAAPVKKAISDSDSTTSSD